MKRNFKARSHGAIPCACDTSLHMRFLWKCSHCAMGLDAICNVLTLESHVTIAQNGCGTYSCATSHTHLNCTHMESHHVNSVINIHTFQFLIVQIARRTVWTSLYTLCQGVNRCPWLGLFQRLMSICMNSVILALKSHPVLFPVESALFVLFQLFCISPVEFHSIASFLSNV